MIFETDSTETDSPQNNSDDTAKVFDFALAGKHQPTDTTPIEELAQVDEPRPQLWSHVSRLFTPLEVLLFTTNMIFFAEAVSQQASQISIGNAH